MAGGGGGNKYRLVRMEIKEMGRRLSSKIGTGLLVVSILGLGWWMWQTVKREMKTVWVKSQLGQATERVVRSKPMELVVEDDPVDKTDNVPKPPWEVPDEQYSIYIPAIAAISKVIEGVDVSKREEYEPALKQGVAEAAGLSHPGEAGTTYLFSHSVGTRADFARYNAVFYLLHKLQPGDGVELVYQGKWLKYAVEKREVLAAGDVKYLVPQKEEEKLVLATCYPPGTTWKRLVVVAKPVRY